ARLARVPLVLITGAGPSSGPRWWDVDIEALATGVDVPVLRIGPTDGDDPAGAGPAAIAHRAYDLAERDRSPVVLTLPCDLSTQPHADAPDAGPAGGARVGGPTTSMEPAQVSQVAAVLAGAQRPLLLLGRGAHLAGAGPALREVGDRVGALFATSAMAAALPGSSWAVGIAAGFAAPD